MEEYPHTCIKCCKGFKKHGWYVKHINEGKCKVQTCKLCGFQTTHPGNFKRHIENRKTACAKNEQSKTCSLCNKNFSSVWYRRSHELKCQEKQEGQMVLIDENRLKKLEELEAKVINNTYVNVENVTINNVVDNSVNNNVNITINNYNDTDYDNSIDMGEITKILSNEFSRLMPDLVKYLHANPDRPENHNIYFDQKMGMVQIFVEKWISQALPDVFNKFRSNAQTLLMRNNVKIAELVNAMNDEVTKQSCIQNMDTVFKGGQYIEKTDNQLDAFRDALPLQKITGE